MFGHNTACNRSEYKTNAQNYYLFVLCILSFVYFKGNSPWKFILHSKTKTNWKTADILGEPQIHLSISLWIWCTPIDVDAFEVIFRMDLYFIYYWSWQPHHRHSSKRISLKTIWILISFIWKIVSRYWETGTQQQNHRFTFFFTLVYDLNSYRTIHILWYCWFSICS